MGTLCLRPDWVHSARFSLGCGRVQGMQGLGVLALVVVAPCGFAAHVATEALGPSPEPQPGRLGANSQPTPSLGLPSSPYTPPPTLSCNQGPWSTPLSTRPAPLRTPPPPIPKNSCEICSIPGARAPTTYPPGTEALGPTPPKPLYTPPLQKTSFFFFFYTLKRQKYNASCEICSVPGAHAPTTYPPGTEALGPPPSPCAPLRPQSLQKTSFLDKSKIRRKLRNLLRSWGPCPYHLPPRHRSPWTPPPRAPT